MSSVNIPLLPPEAEIQLYSQSPMAYNLYKKSPQAYYIFGNLMQMISRGVPEETIEAYLENQKHQNPNATALASSTLQGMVENARRNRGREIEDARRREEAEMEGKEDEGEGLVAGVQPMPIDLNAHVPGEAHHEGQALREGEAHEAQAPGEAHNEAEQAPGEARDAQIPELGEFDIEEEEIEGNPEEENRQMPIDLNAHVPGEVRALLDGIPVPAVAPQEEVLEAPARCCIIL